MSKGKKLWDKALYMLGFENKEEQDYIQEEEEFEVEQKKAHIIGLPTAKQLKVIVIEPTIFEEAQKVSDHLKSRKQVIVNLEHTDRDTAQRVVDFLSGVTYALNGGMQKVGNNIFLFTPNNVIITGEVKEHNDNKIININWEKNIKED